MAPHRQESPLRTSDHAPKRSCLQKYPTPTSTTSFAQNATLFRIKLLPQTHLRTRPCATLYIKKPRRWEAVCPQRGPPSLIRSANSAVAHRQGNKARGMLPCCRESVLRASGHALERPCLPEQPIPTPPMSLAQNATLFRTKLSSKMHLRTRTCASPYEGETETLGRSKPVEEASSWSPPTHSGVAHRERHGMRGMAPSGRELLLRAREHAFRHSCLQE